MNNKDIWQHLCKELAKALTVLDLSKNIQKSILMKRFNRYGQFSSTVLDSYNRSIILAIWYFFDEQWSWSLYDLIGLTKEERVEIENLRQEAQNYKIIRHQKIGHSSKGVDIKDHRRLWWFDAKSLDKIEQFLKNISKFLNGYGARRFNETYASQYGGPDISLQCLIEDLERLQTQV